MTEPDWHSGSGAPHPTGGYDTRYRLSTGVTLHLLNGEFHRLDGPAVERPGGEGPLEWFVNGVHHRLDGPAVTWNDGTPGQFAIAGVDLSRVEHARAAIAISEGAPAEWAIAYATGRITDAS